MDYILYKVKGNQLCLSDISGANTITVDIPGIHYLADPVVNNENNFAVLNGSSDDKKYSLYLFDLKKNSCILKLPGTYYDIYWLDSNSFFYSNGRSIYLYNIAASEGTLIFKYSRIEYSPIHISVNQNKNKIAFTTWKGDDKKINVVSLDTGAHKRFRNSCFNYCWYKDDSILFNYCKGIKLLDTVNEKTARVINTIDTIPGIADTVKSGNSISELKIIIHSDSVSINEVSKPLYLNNRMYFKIFAVNANQKRIGILSLNEQLVDLEVHFMDRTGLIRDYVIFNQPDIVGVYIEPNTATQEKIISGWRYYKNNKHLDVGPFLPVNYSCFPTRFSSMKK